MLKFDNMRVFCACDKIHSGESNPIHVFFLHVTARSSRHVFPYVYKYCIIPQSTLLWMSDGGSVDYIL